MKWVVRYNPRLNLVTRSVKLNHHPMFSAEQKLRNNNTNRLVASLGFANQTKSRVTTKTTDDDLMVTPVLQGGGGPKPWLLPSKNENPRTPATSPQP